MRIGSRDLKYGGEGEGFLDVCGSTASVWSGGDTKYALRSQRADTVSRLDEESASATKQKERRQKAGRDLARQFRVWLAGRSLAFQIGQNA